MAVYTTGGGGGLFGSLLRGAGMASMFVPGMQGMAPWLMGASSLANGDVGGAIGSVAAPVLWKEAGGIFGKAAAPAANAPLDDALTNAHSQNFQLPDPQTFQQRQPQMNESLLNALMRYRRY